MSPDIFLCLTIAASVSGAVWQLSGKLNEMSAYLTALEVEVRDIRSINEFLLRNEISHC